MTNSRRTTAPHRAGSTSASARLRARRPQPTGGADRLDGAPPPSPRWRNSVQPQPGGRPAAPVPRVLGTGAAWAWRLLVVGAVLWFVIHWLAGLTIVTVPIALSLLLAALLHRPAEVLRRWLPRWAAGLLTMLFALAVVAGVVYLIEWRVTGQWNQLIAQAQNVVTQLQSRLADLPGLGSSSTSVLNRVTSWLQGHNSAVVNTALTAGTVIVRLVTGVVLTFFLTLFFLIDGDRMWSWIVRLAPRRVQPATNGAGHRAFRVLSGWIGGTAIIGLIHGVTVGVTLFLLGTPLVFALAVLVFIGSFIPIVGAFLFGGFACLVTLVTQGLGPALILLGVLLTSNLLEGHVYQPLIMGHTVRLHPVTILVALAIGGELDGLFGAIIAVPLAAAVHAAVKYLTGIEDIDGHSLRDEDRMQPEPPPVTAWPRDRNRADVTG